MSVFAWRHPKPHGAAGRCIGARSDLDVDPRRAKRVARRIQRTARALGLPRIVVTSPAWRCAAVGRWLRRWGWVHRIDTALAELDFGAWDGLAWGAIAPAEIDAWCADFSGYAPGGGEPLAALLARAAGWQPGAARVVVSHGGWLLARRWAEAHPDGRAPRAAEWPRAPRYGERLPLAARSPAADA
ncbi:histidine phosphatase family protein [Ideonella sp.]|uniref:histidine phosphatase family protein n=1 Tax=Ideonella sp. TaxID=1929293 RepID=UPI002B4A29EB|nr:histidine phosphatase family protein [Ideonella sp.]HJV71176.1 histidine phosphatase family protein [Ideonella sp.]